MRIRGKLLVVSDWLTNLRSINIFFNAYLHVIIQTFSRKFTEEKNIKLQLPALFCYSTYAHYLRILHSLRNFVDFETRVVLVRCLIMSRLDYCNSILNGLGMKKLSILQKVQNRACGFVYRLHPWYSVSIHLHDLHWLPICMRIRFKILLFVYKSLFNKHLIPDHLDVFEKRAKTSRNGVVLVVPKRSSKLGRDAFDYQGAVLWNKLPKGIREQNGVDQFKSALKTFLFREHFYS